MREIFFPNFDDILLVHAEIIKSTGGSEGLRDAGGLESALNAAENRINYETDDLAKLASTYAFHLSQAHAFVDGNKRIAAFLFLYFMERNSILYDEKGNKRIADNALVALTLMIAVSRPEEKDVMVKGQINYDK